MWVHLVCIGHNGVNYSYYISCRSGYNNIGKCDITYSCEQDVIAYMLHPHPQLLVVFALSACVTCT